MGAGSADGLMGLRPPKDERKLITLEQALEMGAKNNFDVRMAAEKVVQQETMVRKAWAALLPQVNAGANYQFSCNFGRADAFASCDDQTIQFADEDSINQQALLFESIGGLVEQAAGFEQDLERQQELRDQANDLYGAADEIKQTDTDPVVIAPAHVVTGNLSLSLPVFNGRALPLLQNAYTAVDATRVATRQSRSALMYAVARAYYGAVTAKKFIGIAKEQEANARAHEDATRVRVEMNTLAPLNLKRARLEVLKAKQQVRSATSSYNNAVGALGNLIGAVEMFDVQDPGAPKAIETQNTVDDAVSRALVGRDDLRAQKLSLTLADRSKMDAWMLFLPSVSLVAQARMTSNVSGFVAAPVSSVVMLQANIPIYDGGTRYATLREADSKIREQLLKVKQLEQKIEAQVRGNIEDITVKREALDIAKETLQVTRESQEQAKQLFELGMGTPLDVTDTNLALFVAELELARAELSLDQARLGLSYMLGDFPGALPDADAITDDEVDSARQRMDDTPDQNPTLEE